MVFGVLEEEDEEGTEPLSTSPKRPKPLHNFNLPFLKWGTQRHLRCSYATIKDGAGPSTSADRRSSRPNSNESTATPNQSSGSEKRVVIGNDEEEGIAAVREKLTHDLKNHADRIKDTILREEQEETETLKSWKHRTRQIQSKPPVHSDHAKRDFPSPAKIDGGVNVASRLRRNINTNKTERPKFSVQLSRKEIDEDFMAMVGRQPRQRPTKRPKVVQKQLNSVFPGLWLREVTREMYEVLDTKENGKSVKKKGKGKCFNDDDDDESSA
ncbi:unnamed protein product [Lathyrus sativus]|nr:unnamed protein product [Lathyrus sativus]